MMKGYVSVGAYVSMLVATHAGWIFGTLLYHWTTP